MLAPASVQVAAGACSREGVGLGSGGLLVAEGTLVSYEPKAQVRCPEAPTPNQEQPQVQAARLRSPQTPGSHGGWRLWLPPDRESGRQVKALAQGHGDEWQGRTRTQKSGRRATPSFLYILLW